MSRARDGQCPGKGGSVRVLILGAGISGHTAALVLRREISAEHEVAVVSPNRLWNWIPSNIWVGVGRMSQDDVTFELGPVYRKQGISFYQAKATELHPEGGPGHAKPYVVAERTGEAGRGDRLELEYDFLVNATGPRLNFAATPGLGPDSGNSHSVCTAPHAAAAAGELARLIEEMKSGAGKAFVVGTGHGLCTCEGAAFEYVFNLEFELRRHGVRDKARIIYLTNEAELGDFGVGGMSLRSGGFVTPSKVFAESFFAERGVDWILGAHVHQVRKGELEYETLDGKRESLTFDFAMLLPPFGGVPLLAFDKNGADISSRLFNPSGFMKVDADYSGKPFEEWQPGDWPRTYQTEYKNMFAVGIAFAPPHQISRPRKSANGTPIAPSPPRTGMPSAIMGRTVARNIAAMIAGAQVPVHSASMAELGAACVASAGASALRGGAASITMYPIVPDPERFPEGGRSLFYTTGEIGASGHWIKKLLHYAFLYKAKANPLWWIIPE